MSKLGQLLVEDEEDEVLGWLLAHTEFESEPEKDEVVLAFLEDSQRGSHEGFNGEEDLDTPADLLRD